MASAAEQITSWYNSIAGRAPDAEGLNFWTNAANNGASLDSLKSEFTNIVNASKPAATPAPAAAPAPSPAPAAAAPAQSYVDQAKNLYQTKFGRAGDDEGVNFWASALASGRSLDSVSSDFDAAARGTYQDYLTNPNSKTAQYASYLDQDLNGGVKAGSLMGSARDVARSGLEKPIYELLYGKDITKTPVSTDVSQIDLNALAKRTIDPNTETVRGQLRSLLAEDSPLLQQARADGQRQAAERGLSNSTMAASAGEDALIRSALGIATPDAEQYGNASDYNTAATNQALMWNADAQNAAAQQQRDFQNSAALQGQNNSHSAGMQAAQLASQLEIAKLNIESQKYATDAQFKRQTDANTDSLVNNILLNTEYSPERKAAMLEELKRGTSAKKDPVTGKVTAGTGLAGAIYVIDSVTADLAPTPASQGIAAGEQVGGGNAGGA